MTFTFDQAHAYFAYGSPRAKSRTAELSLPVPVPRRSHCFTIRQPGKGRLELPRMQYRRRHLRVRETNVSLSIEGGALGIHLQDHGCQARVHR